MTPDDATPHITVHAMIRYIERVMGGDFSDMRARLRNVYSRQDQIDGALLQVACQRGYDFRAIRSEIAAATRKTISMGLDGHVTVDGSIYVVKQGRVVTVMFRQPVITALEM